MYMLQALCTYGKSLHSAKVATIERSLKYMSLSNSRVSRALVLPVANLHFIPRTPSGIQSTARVNPWVKKS